MRNAIPSEEIAPAGDFLTKAEVVQWLRISERTLENQMRAKKNPIPFRRVGRAPRFRRDEVNRWAENGESCAARRMRARLAEKTEGQGDSQRSVCVL
jgi:excisionase family DNA binding protein